MKNKTLELLALAAVGCTCLLGCRPVASTKVEIKTVTVTNYVTMPPEFGPDGYGYRHLAKAESEMVRDCLMRMDEPWKRATLLEDLTVIKTMTHERMTANEIIDILGKQPNVANVSLAIGAKRSVFSLQTLAFPQYEHEYRLTPSQWKSLQDYCRLQLIDPIAAPNVIKHWQTITNGTVPFGLAVARD